MIPIRVLPTCNAVLNGISAILLLSGYLGIRTGRVRMHRICMKAAVGSSALFLASYLFYHYQTGSKRFEGVGAMRTFYFALLFSHTVLAAAIVPMVFVTLSRALRDDLIRHKRIARWTFPLWMYVSVTGVAVYWVLYHL